MEKNYITELFGEIDNYAVKRAAMFQPKETGYDLRISRAFGFAKKLNAELAESKAPERCSGFVKTAIGASAE